MRPSILSLVFGILLGLVPFAQSPPAVSQGAQSGDVQYIKENLDTLSAKYSAIPSCLIRISKRITFEAVISGDPTPAFVSHISDYYEREKLGARPILTSSVSICATAGGETQEVYFDNAVLASFKEKMKKGDRALFYAYLLWYDHHGGGLVMIVEKVVPFST